MSTDQLRALTPGTIIQFTPPGAQAIPLTVASSGERFIGIDSNAAHLSWMLTGLTQILELSS